MGDRDNIADLITDRPSVADAWATIDQLCGQATGNRDQIAALNIACDVIRDACGLGPTTIATNGKVPHGAQ